MKSNLAILCTLSFVLLGIAEGTAQSQKADKRRVRRIMTFDMAPICESTSGSTYYVRGFGDGENPREARDEAIVFTLETIIFKGVSKGNGGCSQKPLVFNQNILEEKSDFFNEFFSEKGSARKYIKDEFGEDVKRLDRHKRGDNKVFAFQFEVDVKGLKKELENKGIIPKTID